jgi:hypothetical protein
VYDDPECSESPYKEPEGSVKSGAIAGFTAMGIVVLMAFLYGLHVWRSNQQARRYKKKFAKRMADTIDLRASLRQLNPESLAKEFQKIDSEIPGGNISKEALWTFLSTGKVGDLSGSDFNALFAAIDLDQSGEVLTFWSFVLLWIRLVKSTVQRGANADLWRCSCVSSHFGGQYDCSPAIDGGTGNGRRGEDCRY